VTVENGGARLSNPQTKRRITMKNQMRTLLTISTLVLLFALPGFSQIVNGSFEHPLVPSGSYTTFYPPSSIPGWTVVGLSSENVLIVDTNYTVSGVHFHSQSGTQWMDLTGAASNGDDEGVQQQCSTKPKVKYELSYWVGNVVGWGSVTSTVNVQLNGVQTYSDTNAIANSNHLVWKHFSHVFTATAGITTLTFLNGDPADDNINGLDNVQITTLHGGRVHCAKSLRMAEVN
jgi:hypothetical protein